MASQAHTDYTYMDDGTDKLLSIWIPLGDIPLACDSLLYLKDSNRLDISMLRKIAQPAGTRDIRPIAQDLKALSDISGLPWLYSDFKAGDIVVHDPYVVHASLDCNTDAMRLSTDLRFVAATERTDPRWQNAWRGDDGY